MHERSAVVDLSRLAVGMSAVGVLLTVTATVGSISYAAWAVTDRIVAGRLSTSPGTVVEPLVAVAPTSG